MSQIDYNVLSNIDSSVLTDIIEKKNRLDFEICDGDEFQSLFGFCTNKFSTETYFSCSLPNKYNLKQNDGIVCSFKVGHRKIVFPTFVRETRYHDNVIDLQWPDKCLQINRTMCKKRDISKRFVSIKIIKGKEKTHICQLCNISAGGFLIQCNKDVEFEYQKIYKCSFSVNNNSPIVLDIIFLYSSDCAKYDSKKLSCFKIVYKTDEFSRNSHLVRWLTHIKQTQKSDSVVYKNYYFESLGTKNSEDKENVHAP